ncbi:glucosaminidase domain-containing protein [Enterococcus hulanensis]|uniref:Glucosaminidase domain-containing protein n=1 Tax=Enterococcus hulanensis TaxID=2559929 RepID=A0ABU3F0G0_9ENTE|nr:glucosaminidase domain-containing protein [Enterococcus hulanensis]MDT2600611.1 glucosaminidase domain-containing protein [Enterococcus hulanensis]MDT2609651.1 glucosaminidase domain-containing protein [Enterococcus hulanensis]MDT2617721.1 glucosaminidase domain-containing protein [Enterococcus hulanensis]MDT2628946.1 glucosaminidase domain-containing protein [Enterococcus hulanensis]MDT2656286.1 glucosaminidase domain-containing protein [Enterococcus hulanensis]
MKKIVVGICGVLVFIGGLVSIRSGVLKAGELTKESSLIVEIGTGESAVSIPESSETPVEEGIVPDTVEEVPVVEPEVPVTESSKIAESTTSSETPTTSESTPSESSSVESSTSTSSTTSTSSSTKPSSSSTTSSTTKPSSTKPSNSSTSSSTKPSNTKPSNTKPSATMPSSSAQAQSSTSQSQPAPTQPATPVVPSTPAAAAPVTPAYSSVQAESFVAPSAPEAFSETSTLNLPSELKTTEVAQSDLKGFELPLLSGFENKAHAALIYEGIKQLGTEQEDTYDTTQLATELYQQLFELDLTGTPEKLPEELTVGSLLYQKKKDKNSLLGIYIGDDYYLTVYDVEIERETDSSSDTEETTETSVSEEEPEKETQRQVVVESIDLEDDLLVQELPEATLTEYGEQTLAEYPAAMNFTENEGAKSFIETVGEDARKLGQEYDIFASVMIAQALLESGSGKSTLSLAPNYNLFGIKGTYQGQSISMATQEDRGNGELYSINSAFRKYPNYAASLGDYVELLRGGISGNDSYYKQAWRSTAKNYLRTTNALTGTYATDTTYGQKLNSIIALYHLTQYDQVKTTGGNSGVFIKGKEDIPTEYKSRMTYPDYNGVNYNTSGSYPVGQCTWYAFNRVKQLGKTVDDYMGNGGEWATKGKALGYEVSQKPKAGWLISFKPGVAGSDARYGHVAFVEVVRPEGILISEGNVYGGTVISYRVIDNALATSDQVSYIKAK